MSAAEPGRRAARGPAETAGWEPRGAEPSARGRGDPGTRGGGAAAAAPGSGLPVRDGARAPHTRSRRAARGRPPPPRQRPRAVGEGRGTPAGRAGQTGGGRRYLCQGELDCRSHGVSIMHGRGRKDGRTGPRGGKEAEGQAVGEAGGRASPPNFDNFPPHAAPPRPTGPTGRGGAQSPARESEARNQALTPAALENPVRMERRGGLEAEAAPQRPGECRQNAHLSGLPVLKRAGK